MTIDFIKLDILANKSSIFRAQIRKPKVYKQISKKYQIEAPIGHNPDKPFFGEIEFVEEHFKRVINFRKLTKNDKNFATSTSPYELNKVLLEIYMDG